MGSSFIEDKTSSKIIPVPFLFTEPIRAGPIWAVSMEAPEDSARSLRVQLAPQAPGNASRSERFSGWD